MKIADASFVVIDTETTGLDVAVDRLVEVGAVAMSRDRVLGMWSTLVNPDIPIPPEVSAIHGITDADVAGAPTRSEAYAQLADFLNRYLVKGASTLVAHNADFDRPFIQLADDAAPWLCTKRLAMHLWPDYPQHRNQSLRYRRGLKVDAYGIAPHRALGDAIVTAALLRDELSCPEFQVLGVDDVGELIEYAEAQIISPVLRFGSKHHLAPMPEVPASYLEWMLREVGDLDRDTKATVKTELARRGLRHAS